MSVSTDGTDATTETAVSHRTTRRLIVAVTLASVVVVLYLGLSFAFPHKVPRLAVFPKPAEPSTYNTDCNGRSGAGGEVTEHWYRNGLFWQAQILGYGGCPPPP